LGAPALRGVVYRARLSAQPDSRKRGIAARAVQRASQTRALAFVAPIWNALRTNRLARPANKAGENMAGEDFFRGYYEAYNSENPARLGALLADDVVLASAMGETKGKDAYLQTYQFMISTFVDKMRPEKITLTADGAVVDIHDSLVARADVPDFMGQSLKAGEEMVLKLTGKYTLKGGKIARIEIGPREG
jgi:ketosteroid isomerase-like protein